MDRIRVLKEYGDGDGTYCDIEVYATEIAAFKGRKEKCRLNLHSFLASYNEDSADEDNKIVNDALLKAEMEEEHSFDHEHGESIYYDPHTMQYECYNDDYSSYISVNVLPVNR